MRALILGGTGPARELAGRLDELGWHVTTTQPADKPYPAGVVRIDGFGGAAGMAAHLIQNQVQIIVDASHPYNEEITEDATEASRATGVPILALTTPEWQEHPGDQWTRVPTPRAAADHAARHFRHILLDIATDTYTDFTFDPRNLYIVRGTRRGRMPHRFRMLPDVPAESVGAEKKLLQDNQIDGVVLRQVGDEPGQFTLTAARELRIPVVLIDRPAPTKVWGRVRDVDDALAVLIARRRPDPEPGEDYS
ncbi:precorrin-6A/cobalt-precorrin-6A reductase [Corynebacterium halotolerans]|uniref:precorrin-6A/cobalt-precorrin-6A reductase n=1 Tax=Corynebacterium halotolerans TaxID=225326 RepID=UPI003CE86D0A